MDAVLITSGVTLVGIGIGYLGGLKKGQTDVDVERERTRQLCEERAETTYNAARAVPRSSA